MGVEDAARGELDVELERERGAAATKTRSPLDSARIYTNQQKQAKRLVYQLKGVQQTHPQDWLVRHLKGVHEVDK
jgi:hypothetical protein